MTITYRRPGVYLSESLLVNPGNVASASTVSCFVGAAGKGPLNEPTLVESWSDFVSQFGNFNTISDPATPGKKVLTYLPFSVYSYFQNGGRQAWIIRSAPVDEQGTASTISVNGKDIVPAILTSFEISASSTGIWGDTVKYNLATQDTVEVGVDISHDVFTLQILLTNNEGVDEVVETFTALSVTGDIAGTRRVDSVVNDSGSGSQYVRISGVNEGQPQPVPTAAPVSLAGGVDPNIPDSAALEGSAALVEKVEGPVNLNIVGYLADATTENTTDMATSWVSGCITPTSFPDRSDIFVINDSAPPRTPNQSSAAYKTTIQTSLSRFPGDSYIAAHAPWIKVPHPQRVGTIIDIPIGGAIMGMTARIDATIGVFRAPAGVIAGLSNAVGVQTKFTDTELGDLNSQNINITRSVVGAGIATMGARTRKSYGADRYVSARRTLIYINEVLKRSTQFAVFENNDQRLWSALRISADRILRPLWEAGGLRGASASEAYFIRCDGTNNTPAVIQSGEVRMEVGVALEYPAEFVVIRITQFDRGTFTNEVQPSA